MYQERILTLTPGGALTIPPETLAKAGLAQETEVELFIDGGTLSLRRKRRPAGREAIEAWIKRVAGTAGTGMTTDEVMALTRGED